MSEFRIVFMGTPEFAVPTLDALLKKPYKVTGVITAPDKPRGRGQRMSFSPVKDYALEHGLPILQPVSLKDEGFIRDLKSLNASLFVVVAFRMLPEAVWKMPDLGTINLHGSLLPEYRGAAPVNWVLINGEIQTGLTTFYIDREIDTGKMILQEKEDIFPEDDAGCLHDRLMIKGADLVLKTVEIIRIGKAIPVDQPLEYTGKKAPKITKDLCRIDFRKTAIEIYNLIRGLSPSPGAFTEVHSKNVKIFKARAEEGQLSLPPGDFSTDNRTFLKFMTGKGIINVLELQAEGRKRMPVSEFFKGNKL